MLVVITYAFPADGGSKVLTAQSLVEVSFFIRSCQLVAHRADGKYSTSAFPADVGSRGLAAHSLGLVEVSFS